MPGNGYLYFNNGDVHEGIFEGGRAHGEGVLLTAKGDEYRGNGCSLLYKLECAWLTIWNAGTWAQNKRKGIFKIVDGEGCLWTEKYDDDGKRTLRKKVLVTPPLSLFLFQQQIALFVFLSFLSFVLFLFYF